MPLPGPPGSPGSGPPAGVPVSADARSVLALAEVQPHAAGPEATPLRRIFTALLDQLPAATVVTDAGARVRHANRQFCERLLPSRSPEALVGEDWESVARDLAAELAEPDGFLEAARSTIAGTGQRAGLSLAMRDGRMLSLYYAPVATPMGLRHLWMFHDITGQEVTRQALARSNALLERVGESFSHYVAGGDTRRLFDGLLADALALSQSEYGFIGRALHDADGNIYLKTYALTNIAWNKETRALFDQHHEQGMEFRNLDTLFGQVLATGRPVVSNSPAEDPRSGGLPPGHPPLNAFLGIPLHVGEQLVGMVGVANRPGGYDNGILDYLGPFLAACGNLIHAEQSDRQRQEHEQRLSALGSVMLGLGPDSRANVQRLVVSLGELLGADCAWYRRVERPEDRLALGAAWQAGQEAHAGISDAPAAAAELLDALGGPEQPVVLRRVAELDVAGLEPVVWDRKCETWLAHVTGGQEGPGGVLNAAFGTARRLTETDLEIMRIIASAITAEEFRGATLEALRRSKQQFSDLYRNLNEVFTLSPDGFLSVGRDNRIVMVSAGFTAMTGIEADRIVGRSLQEFDVLFCRLLDDECRSGGLAASLDAHEKGEPLVNMVLLRQPRSRVLQRLIRMPEGGEAHARAVVCFRDITAETEVDRMKSQFLATAAHELRTPIASVYGFSELLVTRAYDEDTSRELYGVIHSQARRLVEMINELLDLARIEAQAGKDFDIGPGDLIQVVNDAIRETRLPEDPRDVVLDAPQDLPAAMLDADKMTRAFANILSNARKYSGPDAEIRVRGSVCRHGDRDWVAMSVSDQGIGMTPEQLERVFERFYRADPSGNIPGSGLGMSLVREIVDIHEGRIEIQSRPGEGTTVTLLIPIAPGATVGTSRRPASPEERVQ